MSAVQIIGRQTSADKYEVTAAPDHGKTVTLRVERGMYRTPRGPYRAGFLVRVGNGYITAHTTFGAGVRSANARARRYVNAYSVPRTRSQP